MYRRRGPIIAPKYNGGKIETAGTSGTYRTFWWTLASLLSKSWYSWVRSWALSFAEARDFVESFSKLVGWREAVKIELWNSVPFFSCRWVSNICVCTRKCSSSWARTLEALGMDTHEWRKLWFALVCQVSYLWAVLYICGTVFISSVYCHVWH